MKSVIALVDKIMEDIEQCRTGAQISHCAKLYAKDIRALGESDEHKVRVIHIRNYAALRRKQIMAGTAHKTVVFSGRVCDKCGGHPAPFGFTEHKKTTWSCGDCRAENMKGK